MKSSITRKLVFTALALVALTLTGLDWVARSYAEKQELNAVAGRLSFAATSIAAGGVRPAQLRSWSRDIGAEIEVLHQTGSEPAGDPEILEALRGHEATAVRWRRLHLAAPAIIDGEHVVLRLSEPLDFAAADRFRLQLASITLLSALAGLFIAYLAWRSLATRISRLKDFAEALLEARPPASGPASQDELGALEGTLSRVAAQLRDLFDRWRLESSRSEAILSSMAEGVLAVDRQLRVVFCNHAVTRTMRLRSPVKERTPLIELIRDADVIDMLSQVISSGESLKRNFRISAANNRAFEVPAGAVRFARAAAARWPSSTT